MIFQCLFLCTLVFGVELINDTTPITINKRGELNYEIDVGADGVEFTLVTISQLSFKGIQNDKSKLINIILNFHDDDYHNTPFSLTTENVRITFACDDPIKFSLNSLVSHNTDFSSTKPIYANVTSSQDIEFDYTSFVNGFGAGCTLSGSKIGDGLYSEFNSELQVQLPDTVKEITFSETSFKVELENGEKDSFSNVFNQNYQIILLSNEDKDEIIIDATSQNILGNITVIAEKAILNATDDFKQVAKAMLPIKVCCEIIILPYDSVPEGIFKYINKEMEEKLDQVVMTNGIRSYCLYDNDNNKCDIYGTIPFKIESSSLTVHSGKSISYVLCTSSPIRITITNTAASSLTINGTSKMNEAVILSQDLSSITDGISLENIKLQIQTTSSFNVKNMYIGSNVTFYGQGWYNFKFAVSNSFNSSFDWYKNNIESSTIFSIEFKEGSTIIIYDFNNIAHLFLGEDDCFKIQYDDEDESKVVKFPNENNRIIIYTNDKYFSMDVQGNNEPYGNFELHVLLLDDLTDLLTVEFPQDWKYVTTLVGGPIGLHVETLSRNKNTILIPFDDFPSGFIDYDKDSFNLYSTVNTTICLYNEGKDECTPVIGGRSCVIPSTGEITIDEGTQYIYSADEKVTIPENLHFVFSKNSAKAIGFNFNNYGKVKLTVSDDTLKYLYLNKVNFTCEVTSASKQLKVNNYVNYYSSFSINSPFLVDQSIVISVSEFRDFEDKNYSFTGKMMTVIDPGLINEIEFTEDDWTIDLQNGGNPFRIDEHGMTLKIESSSSNVTFDVTEGAKTLTTLDFTSTSSNSIIYFTKRWTDSTISINSPVQLHNDVQCTNVQLYHPFAYLDSESSKKLVNYAPQIKDCPYHNTSICLSIDGSSDCGISAFHLKEAVSQGSVFTVPYGYRFQLLLSDDSMKITYDSSSAKNISIQSYNKDVRPVTLTITDSMPTDTLMMMNDLQVTFETSLTSIQWKLKSLDLFDTTFTSPVTSNLAVSENCSVEMDIFYKMTKDDGVFSKGKLTVNGFLTLRDSNEEYLNEIQLSTDGWKLITSVCSFEISKNQFENLIFGVNRPPKSNPHFIPLTLSSELQSGQIAGNLDINIEEENLYLQIGHEWSNVKSIIGDKINVRSTHGKGTSRFLYDNDVEPLKFFTFDSTVHAINNKTCPICLLPSEDYVSACFLHSLDMLPVISNDKNFLLDESRDYIIFGSPDDVHDFRYRTDIDYSVSVIAANKVTVKMNNAPSNVDFYFDSLIDDEGECDLIFEKSMTLKSLRFDDSVRISTESVENFKLTLNELTIDFKGFRRFFREPGIFSKENSIEVNGYINIVDDGRYETIQCGPNYWNLIGNENAWNTTFKRRGSSQRLKITTPMPIINVSASIPSDTFCNSVLSVSFTIQSASTQIFIEPSICDIETFSDGKSVISSVQALSVYSPLTSIPFDLFTMNGSYQVYQFKPTEQASICLYEEGKEACKVDGTTPMAVNPSKPFKIRCASKCSLVLSGCDVSLSFGEASASVIDIKSVASSSSKLKASLSFGTVKIEKLNVALSASSIDLVLTDSGRDLSFDSVSLTNSALQSNSDISVKNGFASEFSSLQTFSKQLTVEKSLSLSGDSASFAPSIKSAGPTIVCSGAVEVKMTNIGSIFSRFDFGYDEAKKTNKVVFGTSNDDANNNLFTFLNLPVSNYGIDFQNEVIVYANWIGGTTDSSLIPIFSYNFQKTSSFSVSKSSSATTNWPQPKSTSSSLIQVKTSSNELDLSINSAVSLKISESTVKVNYESLLNVVNVANAFDNSNLNILIQNSAKTVGIGQNKVKIADVAFDPVTTIKQLTIVHQNSMNNLSVSLLDKSSVICDMKFKMDGGTHLYLNQGFSSVSSGQISFEKSIDGSGKATVYVLDADIPSVIKYDGNIEVVLSGGGGGDDSDDGDKNRKMKGGIIAAIVIAAIILIAAICVTIVYIIRSRKIDITAYDYAPPLLNSNTGNKELAL